MTDDREARMRNMQACKEQAAWILRPPGADRKRQMLTLEMPIYADDPLHVTIARIFETADGRWRWTILSEPVSVCMAWSRPSRDQGTELTLRKAQEAAETGWITPKATLSRVLTPRFGVHEVLWKPGDPDFEPPKTVVLRDGKPRSGSVAFVDLETTSTRDGRPVINVMHVGRDEKQGGIFRRAMDVIGMPERDSPLFESWQANYIKRYGVLQNEWPHLGVNLPAGAAVAVGVAHNAELLRHTEQQPRPVLPEMGWTTRLGVVDRNKMSEGQPIRVKPMDDWSVLTKPRHHIPYENLKGSSYCWLQNLVRQHIDVTNAPGAALLDHLRRELMCRSGHPHHHDLKEDNAG